MAAGRDHPRNANGGHRGEGLNNASSVTTNAIYYYDLGGNQSIYGTNVISFIEIFAKIHSFL